MTPNQIGEYLEHQGATDEEIDEFLEHFGVKGMKWGQRKAKQTAEPMTKEERQKKKKRTAVKAVAGVGVGTLAAGYLAVSTLGSVALQEPLTSVIFNDLRRVGEKLAFPVLVGAAMGSMTISNISEKVMGR